MILTRFCSASAGILAGFCYEPQKIQTLLLSFILLIFCWDSILGFYRNVARILRRFCQDSGRILLGFGEDSFQILMRFSQDSAEIVLGFCLNAGFYKPYSCSDILLLMLESAQIEFPGRHFADFLGKGQKVLKSSLLDVILSTSGAKARKCSNRYSWASFCPSLASFCRLLEPRPESA